MVSFSDESLSGRTMIDLSGLLVARLRVEWKVVEARPDLAKEPDDCVEFRDELRSLLRSKHAPSETERKVLE